MRALMFARRFEQAWCVLLCVVVACAADQATANKVTLAEEAADATQAEREAPGDPRSDGAESTDTGDNGSESDDSWAGGFTAVSWDRLSGATAAKLSSLAQPTRRCGTVTIPSAPRPIAERAVQADRPRREPRIASRPQRPHAPPTCG
jgi:hypothetical protein